MQAQLLQSIQNELRSLARTAPVLSRQTAIWKLYEIFILACLTRALRNIGARLEPRDYRDRQTNSLEFRLGPGLLYSPTTTPGFIFVEYQGTEYEIHNGLQVLGRSKVLHELDVCLVERNEAERCRFSRTNPRQSKTRFLAECKYYGSTLPLSLGREFLGLKSDFSLRIKTIVSNVGSDEVHTLVTKHKATENFDISPIKPRNVERFVQWLANELRQIL